MFKEHKSFLYVCCRKFLSKQKYIQTFFLLNKKKNQDFNTIKKMLTLY
jgi:hypothetical protein